MEHRRDGADTVKSAMGQAYQVIGAIAQEAGLLEHPDVQRALEYFAANQFRENFLPFSLSDAQGTNYE